MDTARNHIKTCLKALRKTLQHAGIAHADCTQLSSAVADQVKLFRQRTKLEQGKRYYVLLFQIHHKAVCAHRQIPQGVLPGTGIQLLRRNSPQLPVRLVDQNCRIRHAVSPHLVIVHNREIEKFSVRNFGEQRTVFLRMNELAVDLRRSIFPVGKKGSFLRSSRLRFHFPVLLQYLFCNLRKRHALQTAFIQKLHVDRRCNPVLLSADDKRLFFDTVQLLHRFYLHLKIIAGFSFQQRGKLLFEHLIVHFFPPFLFDCFLYFCFTEQKSSGKHNLKTSVQICICQRFVGSRNFER